MKKILPILLILLLTCSLFACRKTEEEEQKESDSDLGVVNPVHDSTPEEIMETLGITLNVPEDAQDVSYYMIDADEDIQIAQAKFTIDNTEYTYRVKSAASFEDISGAYFDWTSEKDIEISYCSGKLQYIEGEQGICLWYDTVPGLMYCIYAGSDASEEGLLALADELYIPAEDVP
jgi:hypothetical protein